MPSEHKTDTTIRRPVRGAQAPPVLPVAARSPVPPTAVVYCEGHFGEIDGKIANGLVRHSEAYRILSVIDRGRSGQDSGLFLDGVANRIPILGSLADALAYAPKVPETFILGMAPATGRLSVKDRAVVLDEIAHGMTIVSGLHEYLSDDPQIAAQAAAHRVTIRDMRKPKPNKDMRLFDGSISGVKALRIAVLGTDCAIGKRTTATVLARALSDAGFRTALVGTGQTGLMQGAKYGVAMDAVPPQFCCGELEGAILATAAAEQPDIIVIEGQGALSHPAFCTSAFILRGSQPDALILQHAPKLARRCDFPGMPMPSAASEIALIEAFADTRVIGLTLNHEGMSDAEITAAIATTTCKLGVPVTDALRRPGADLVSMVLAAYPGVRQGTYRVAV